MRCINWGGEGEGERCLSFVWGLAVLEALLPYEQRGEGRAPPRILFVPTLGKCC